MKLNASDFFGNVLFLTRKRIERDLNKLRKRIDRNDWGERPATVNAFYSSDNNEISKPIFQRNLESRTGVSNFSVPCRNIAISCFSIGCTSVRPLWTHRDGNRTRNHSRIWRSRYASVKFFEPEERDFAFLKNHLILLAGGENLSSAERFQEVKSV